MEQQEQVEWDDVNKLLQHHGFKPVYFTDPIENKNLSDLVLLDKKSAGEIRTTLRTMLADSERRQALIQELIKSNNQLKEEASEHMSRAAQYSRKVSELEALLDTVKTRVQDLEDRCLGKAAQRHNHSLQLQEERQEAQKRCRVLELQLSKQKEEAAELQRKLYFTIKEEERRLTRQNQTFKDVCNKVSRQNSPADQQVLDVIDFYETKMTRLLGELRSARGEPQRPPVAHQTRVEKTSSNVTPSFKTILRAYQDQQRGSKIEMEELKRQVERLQQELETRPTRKDVKFYKHKLRLLEASNKANDTSFPQEDTSAEAALCASYHHLLDEICAVVTNPEAPFRLHRQKPSRVGLEQFHTLLPTLEVWAQQLHLLKDLQRGLNKLTVILMPWQPSDDATETVKVEDMMLLVDTMLENTSTDDEKVLRSPTRHTLASMVSHFQKLFDVASLSGVYPRMNEVYARLGEVNNTMRNLRDVLELDGRVPPTEVVNHVARLVSSTAGVHNLLGDADFDSIILKVKQHDEFFPAFHGLIVDILQILGESHLDDILPALRSLKQIT